MTEKRKPAVPRKVKAVTKGITSVLDGPAEPIKESKAKPATKKPARVKSKTVGVAAPAAKKVASGSKKKAPGAAPEGTTKRTYYVEDALLEGMVKVGMILRRGPGSLVNEAIEDFVKKHTKGKRASPR